MEKTCTKCLEIKALEEFAKSKQVKSGYGAWCKPCARKVKTESNRRVKEENPEAWLERRREYVKAYKNKYPDRVAEKDWSYRIKTKFGITSEEYYQMLDSQNGVCAGCLEEPKTKKLAVDHDRSCCSGNNSCGKCIRGLLCSNCNTALGLLKENEETIARLSQYMKGFK